MNVTPLSALHQQRSISPADFYAALDHAATGASILSIAERLGVPRSTLRDRFEGHSQCPLPSVIKDALVSPEGQDFLVRFNVALHVHVRNVCACGLRVLSNVLRDTGLDAFVGASHGAQWDVGRAVDEAIVAYGENQLTRISPALKGREITLALDENFHEGPCLIGIEPASNFVVAEVIAQTRGVEDWKHALSPILATLGVHVVQVTSDSGSSILALTQNVFEAHHSPDLFHILYDFRRTFAPSMRAARRALLKSLDTVERELATIKRMDDRFWALTPKERGRGRPPDFEKPTAEQEIIHASSMDALAALERHEVAIKSALRDVTDGYHPVNLATGKRTGRASFETLLASVLAKLRSIILERELAQGAPEALAKLERMGEKMASTLERVEATWRARAHAATPDPKARYVLESLLAPALYLERLASRTTTLKAHALLTTAAALRFQAIEALGGESVRALEAVATTMALDFQRSSSMVEGRNGQLSLRHHAFHELSLLKRNVLTTLHNYVLTRPDGTTAAERFSGVKPEPLMNWLCAHVKTVPSARPRRAIKKAS